MAMRRKPSMKRVKGAKLSSLMNTPLRVKRATPKGMRKY